MACKPDESAKMRLGGPQQCGPVRGSRDGGLHPWGSSAYTLELVQIYEV